MNDYLQVKELYHHGIKGQKWGVRRYQNEDGTLTEAGQKHYDDVHKKFYNNVMDVEESISKANLHNLQRGRRHEEDDLYSKTLRSKARNLQEKGRKYLYELFDSGYYQTRYGFDPKTTSYESFMSAVEKSAAQEFIEKNGRYFTMSPQDDNGSEEYEKAIIESTKARR